MGYVEESVPVRCVDTGIGSAVLDAVEEAAEETGYRTVRTETDTFSNNLTTKGERLDVYCDGRLLHRLFNPPDLRIEMDNVWAEYGEEVVVEMRDGPRYDDAVALVEDELAGCA